MPNSVTTMEVISVEGTVFWYIGVGREQQLVRMIRAAAPYREYSEINESFALIDSLLAAVDRKQHRLLMDLRKGPPGRNDPEFERDIAPIRRDMFRSFHRVAILVRSASGLLQLKRYLQEDSVIHAAVFMSEAHAMRYLDP